MLTTILTGLVIWWLLAGTLPPGLLAVLSLCGASVFFAFGRHNHGGLVTIDVLSRRSALGWVNPGLKVWGSMGLLVLCIAAQKPWAPLILAGILLLITVWGGKLALHDYISLFSLPAVFLLLSGVALLWSWTNQPGGVIDLPFAGGYLSIQPSTQQSARLVMARAFGAVSCLYFLSLSTPMPEIITVLRRAHVPRIMTDLSVLMYRSIFLLFDTYHQMKDAAESRLGFENPRRSLHTTGKLYGLLLANSFRKAGARFDAMESRCYEEDIRFITQKKPLTAASVAVASGLIIVAAFLSAATF